MKAPESGAFTASSKSAFIEDDQRAPCHRVREAPVQMLRSTLGDDPADGGRAVKLISTTAGWSIRAPTISPASAGALVTTLTDALGSPASAKGFYDQVRGCGGKLPRLQNHRYYRQASGTAMARTPRMNGRVPGRDTEEQRRPVRVSPWPGTLVCRTE